MWRKETPCALFVGMKIGAATVENSMEFPQNIKIELTYDTTIPLLGTYLKKMKTPTQKDIFTPCSLQHYL